MNFQHGLKFNEADEMNIDNKADLFQVPKISNISDSIPLLFQRCYFIIFERFCQLSRPVLYIVKEIGISF